LLSHRPGEAPAANGVAGLSQGDEEGFVLDTNETIGRLRDRGALAALALVAGVALALGAAAPEAARRTGEAEARAVEGRTAATASGASVAGGAETGGRTGASVEDGERRTERDEPLLADYLAERAEPGELFGGIPDSARRQRLWDEMRTFYERREFEPAWSERGRLRRPARELVGALADAAGHGLEPADYRAADLTAAVEGAGRRWQLPERLAELDAALTAAFLAHAADLCCGRVGAERAGRLWNIETEPVDLAAALEAALAGRRIDAALDRLDTPHPEARRLAEALARYRGIAAAGGWPEVPVGPRLEPGDEAEPARLAALADRLRAEGDLSERAAAALRARWRRAARTAEEAGEEAGNETLPRYDRPLVAAVRRFQARNGLETDGRIGEDTVAALNVTAAERAARLALNLERWRWLPADLGERHLRVNVADYRLTAHDRGREALSMAVVVGRRSWPTPIFSELMTRVELNPYWHVPESIARAEIVPEAQEDPDYLSYLAKKGYQLVDRDTGERLDPASVSLAEVGDGVRLRQRPGRGNALGRIKFLFPNRFNVYLHDTPQQASFERTRRAFSHGCIRVARPLELADFVFAGEPGWTPGRVREEIADGVPERAELERPIPVHILYWTAFVDGDGRVHFRPDVYGHDDGLAAALAGARDDRLAALLAPEARRPAADQSGGTSAG
jgi:murein L,D-transpeptidase YcbB/YkuD